MNMYICKNIGVTTLKIHWMRSKCGKLYWCRRAVAIMGSFNLPFDEVAKISPFDPAFRDNFIEGKGNSKEEAISIMDHMEKELADLLWA